MTPLRKRMIDELQLRNLSTLTADVYVKAVERFAKHFHASPERLGPEQIRQYLLYLINERKVCFNTLRIYCRHYKPKLWLFPSQQRSDQPLEHRTVRYLCRNAGQRAGLKQCIHPHLFRHACATHMLDAGADLRTIQHLLGHADIRTTARYLHVSTHRIQATRSPFDGLSLSPIAEEEEHSRP